MKVRGRVEGSEGEEESEGEMGGWMDEGGMDEGRDIWSSAFLSLP